MSRIAGQTVLITGGASGIGLIMARRFAEEGARCIVLWDMRPGALSEAVDGLRERFGPRVRISGYPVDITRREQMLEALEALGKAGIAVDVLVNNAGVIVGKKFVEHSAEEIERTMAVNTLAPMLLTRELLPGMMGRGGGHIVNIASAAGMVSNPGMAVYCGSKWAAIGWSDSLRIELERAGGPVHVTTVTPYYINTGMFDGVKSRVIPILDPERVGRTIVAAVKKDKLFVRLPGLIRFVPLMRGLLPARLFDKIGGEWMGVYHTMDTFRGRMQ